jgi:hypothetical protein
MGKILAEMAIIPILIDRKRNVTITNIRPKAIPRLLIKPLPNTWLLLDTAMLNPVTSHFMS